MLIGIVAVGTSAVAQPATLPPARQRALCESLFQQRHTAESQGRIDFSVVVETVGSGEPLDVTAHVQMGSPYAVGRIHFTGHRGINDSTLRRAMTLRERDLLDVTELRRSLARINDLGLAEPLTLADLIVTRHADTATADVTIPVQARRRRWWSLSGPIIPGLESYHASISSRLPAWGRGVFDASTYVVTFNALGLVTPFVGALPFLSKVPTPVLAFERPYVPGQGLLSGFAVSPGLPVPTTLAGYGRSHLMRGLDALLGEKAIDPLAVPIVGSGPLAGEHLVCIVPTSRWRWLRYGLTQALDLAMAAVLPTGR